MFQMSDFTVTHGRLAKASWAAPRVVTECDQAARPGYSDQRAHEYVDETEVMAEKVNLLATWLRASASCVCYTGAGISTAAGIADYASVSEDSAAGNPLMEALSRGQQNTKAVSPMAAQPTFTHRALVGLNRAGLLKYWVQQNHDGLPQKAGLPQECINEIHGALYDPSNPVIPMSGSLREDLFSDFLSWCEKTDLCLALGTSLSGMNCDRIVENSATRLAKKGWDTATSGLFGSVIIGLQSTQYDHLASLRIYGCMDHVFELLTEELELGDTIPPADYTYSFAVPEERQPEPDVYLVPYSADGRCLGEKCALSDMLRWDLRVDAKLVLTQGQFAGDLGDMVGRNKEGHFKIRFFHEIGKKKSGQKSFKAPMERTLGTWWVEAVIKGKVNMLPCVNAV